MVAQRFLGGVPGSVLLALLAGALTAAPAPALVPDDLRLGEAGEPQRRTEPLPNPHSVLGCVQCHLKGGVTYEVAQRFGMRMPLVTEGEATIVLCDRCHKDYHPFHPVNFPVRRLAGSIERAAFFPLEMPFEGYHKLTCVSCHAVHFPHAANRLLRGFAVDARTGAGQVLTRLDFCRSCHGADEILALSGHRALEGEAGCSLCHGTRVSPESIGPLKKGLNRTCAVCHPAAPGTAAHYAAYNPFPGLAPAALQAAGVELVQGRYTCATCHQHHRVEAKSPFLKPGFLTVVSSSPLVNPHRSTRFCLNCHTGNAPPDTERPEVAAPLVDSDVTRLCQGCHERDGALRMHHPLVAPSQETPIPPGWPLRADGTLGCETCHLAGHGPGNPANPRFLRTGGSRPRNQICFRCHAEDPARSRNLHAEVAVSEGCDFCHVGPVPNAGAEGVRAGPLRAEPNLLCLRCHDAPPHPASAVHTVRPPRTTFVRIDESCSPLTLGKVTCHSCHDSHAGTLASKLLRAKDQQPVCPNCHPF